MTVAYDEVPLDVLENAPQLFEWRGRLSTWQRK